MHARVAPFGEGHPIEASGGDPGLEDPGLEDPELGDQSPSTALVMMLRWISLEPP